MNSSPLSHLGSPQPLPRFRFFHVINLLQYRRPRFNAWVRKIPWRRAWQPTPVFLPAELHGQRSLADSSPWGHKESDKTEQPTHSSPSWYTLISSLIQIFSCYHSHLIYQYYINILLYSYVLLLEWNNHEDKDGCVFFHNIGKSLVLHSENDSFSLSVMSDSSQPHRLRTPWLLCPWDSPDKNTGVGCHALLQGIFLTQGSNLGLLHCWQILYCLSHQGSEYSL